MAIALVSNKTVQLADLEEEDLDEAQAVLKGAPRYHRLVYGRDVMPDAARRIYERKPGAPTRGMRVWKRFLGIFPAGREEMVGVVDLFVGYPRYDVSSFATFVLREAYQRRGIGSATVALLEQWLRRQHPAVRWIDVSITDDNLSATRFLIKNGFERTNDWEKFELDGKTKRIIRLERAIGSKSSG